MHDAPDMTKPPASLDLVGTSIAAKILGVHPSTITRMVTDDLLTPAARVGDDGAFMFHRADVVALAEKRAADAKASR